jgi:hypothetical protein
VTLADVSLGQHEIVALNASDGDSALIEELSALGAALLTDDDREHRW